MATRQTSKKRILVAGAGRWGKVFLKNLESHSRGFAAGLVSRQDRQSLPALPPDSPIYASLEDALTHPWHGVMLATPPETHAAQVELCLKANIPVLVEKPFTLSSDQARDVAIRYRERAHLALVDHIFLFNPGYLELKRQLGQAGPIRRIYSEGGNTGPYMSYSALWNYGAHDVAMILDLLEATPSRIEASARDVGTRDGGLRGEFNARLHFASGVIAEFKATNASEKKIRRIVVQTDDEEYVMDDVPRHKLTRTDRANGGTVELACQDISPLANVFNVFFDGIDGKTDRRWGLQLGVQVVEILEACERVISRE